MLDIELAKDNINYLNGVSSCEHDTKYSDTIVKITNCANEFERFIAHYFDRGIVSGGKDPSADVSIKSIESMHDDSCKSIEIIFAEYFTINARNYG